MIHCQIQNLMISKAKYPVGSFLTISTFCWCHLDVFHNHFPGVKLTFHFEQSRQRMDHYLLADFHLNPHNQRAAKGAPQLL